MIFLYILILVGITPCSGALGDLMYSPLPLDKFTQFHGDCWELFDEDVDDVKLSSLYGISINTNPEGLFIRSIEYKTNNVVDADRGETEYYSIQNNEMKSHRHSLSDWYRLRDGTKEGDIDGNDPQDQYNGYSYLTKNVGSFGQSSETRPINRNFYLYIRTK